MSALPSKVSQLFTFIAFGFAFCAAFALSRALIRVAGVDIYAEYALYLTIGFALRIVWFGILGPVCSRGYSIARENGSLRLLMYYFGVGLILPFVLLCLLAIGAVVFHGSIQLGYMELTPIGLVAGGLIGANIAAAGAVVEVANAAGRRWQAIFAMIYPAGAQLLALLILLAVEDEMSGGVTAVSIAVLASVISGPILALQYIMLRRGISQPSDLQINTDGASELGHFLYRHSMTMAFWIPPSLLLRAADKWFAATLLSASDFAAFTLITLLTQGAMAAGMTILSRVALPRIYNLVGNYSDTSLVKQAHRLTDQIGYLVLLAGALMTGTFALWGDLVLLFVADETFAQYHFILVCFAAGATLQSYSLFQITHGHIAKNIKPFTPYKYGEGVIYFAAIAMFLPAFGLVGAAAAFVASGVIGACLAIWGRSKLVV